jgi:hypothetical protein
MKKFVQVVRFVPRKIFNYTKSINTALEAPLAIGDKWTSFEKWVTKIFGSTSGAALFGKGAGDAAIAYACDDGVCFVISCVVVDLMFYNFLLVLFQDQILLLYLLYLVL